MALSFTEKRSIRKNFGKLKEILSIPNLIDVQKESYSQFLKVKKKSESRIPKNKHVCTRIVEHVKLCRFQHLLAQYIFQIYLRTFLVSFKYFW